MKISTRGKYGLRAMAVIAASDGGRNHVPLSDIAASEGISESYLEQIFAVLRKAGLVRSVKGAQGGYCLADRPEAVTAGDVLRALEGRLSLSGPDDPGGGAAEMRDSSGSAGGMARCIAVLVWNEIDRQINSVADSVTLADIAREYNKTLDSDSLTYMI